MNVATSIDEGEAWAAVIRRDRSADERFVTGVLTTGIYCRPSCPARHPKRENVRFFAPGAEAAAAGPGGGPRGRPGAARPLGPPRRRGAGAEGGECRLVRDGRGGGRGRAEGVPPMQAGRGDS